MIRHLEVHLQPIFGAEPEYVEADEPIDKIIDEIRSDCMGSMQNFIRAISRFCRAQDEPVDPPTQVRAASVAA